MYNLESLVMRQCPPVSRSLVISRRPITAEGASPGQKRDINVVFTPTATGNRAGTLTISFGGSIPSQKVASSGVGTAPAVSLSPPALYFGVQAIGTTGSQQQVTITNPGTGSLTVSSIQTTTQFAATNTGGAPVAPRGNSTIQVTLPDPPPVRPDVLY
jgi:hypothetical protein